MSDPATTDDDLREKHPDAWALAKLGGMAWLLTRAAERLIGACNATTGDAVLDMRASDLLEETIRIRRHFPELFESDASADGDDAS